LTEAAISERGIAMFVKTRLGMGQLGMYRNMLHDSKSIGWLIHPGSHAGLSLSKNMKPEGRPCLMALVIGAPPACALASMSAVTPYMDEVDIAED